MILKSLSLCYTYVKYFGIVLELFLLIRAGKMEDQLSEKLRKQIKKAVDILSKGGVIAFPTDTVYGLGTGLYNESGIKRIFEIKKRSASVALPVLLADITQFSEVSRELSAQAWMLIKKFMPGGLTLIVYRSQAVSDLITAGGDTVAVRIPDHPVPRALIKGLGMPIIGTSANISGKPTLISAEDVRRELGKSVDMVIDAEPPPNGKESTVVDMASNIPIVLREGAISRAQIAQLIELG
jgi:L-threonylcarbamoyladenylate synthase